MSGHATCCFSRARFGALCGSLSGAALLAFGGACTAPTVADRDPASAVEAQAQVASATPADADRQALARLVGVWSFEGWSVGKDGSRKQATGLAAAAIENRYFVLLDIEASAGELGGRAGRKSGSMILASEPGIGLTLTAWGDASASICRLVGRVSGDGKVFTFEESRTPADLRRLSLVLTFETSERWTAEVRDASAPGRPIIAFYTFHAGARPSG